MRNIKTELSKAVAECSIVKRDIETLKEYLPQDIRNKLDLNLNNILDECLEHFNGLEFLLAIILSFEGNSNAAGNLYRLLLNYYKIPELIITTEQHRELMGILISIDEEDIIHAEIGRLYNSCLPSNSVAREFPYPYIGLLSYVAFLGDTPPKTIHKGKVYPLFTFIRLLQENIKKDEDSRNKLEIWLEKLNMGVGDSISFQSDSSTMTTLDSRTETKKQENHLLLTIDPKGLEKSQSGFYYVEAYLWREENNVVTVHKSEHPLPFGDLEGTVDEIIQKLANDPDENKEIGQIEFFLPIGLLSSKVDQFRRSTIFKELKPKLGCRYRIIVRSLERMQEPELNRNLKGRWQAFEANHRFIPDSTSKFPILQDRKFKEEEMGANLKEHTWVGLSFTPKDERTLAELLFSGIPVALWPRPDGIDGSCSEKIRQLICRTDDTPEKLKSLPSIVQEYRVEGTQRENDENHLGNHLTLLWDNPNRRLPRKPFVSPM